MSRVGPAAQPSIEFLLEVPAMNPDDTLRAAGGLCHPAARVSTAIGSLRDVSA